MGVCSPMQDLGVAELIDGDRQLGARLVTAARRQSELLLPSMDATQPLDSQRAVRRLTEAVADPEVAVAAKAGRTLSLEEAVAEALGGDTRVT